MQTQAQTQTQIYGVVLPVHIAQRARVVAAMNGTSRSSLMRDLLLDYLKRYEVESVDPSPLGVQSACDKLPVMKSTRT
jgi:hypothetical protein